ncbi:MAG: zinc ribbon domain-containing protein [Candidatus Nanoarchaeia archaeon]|jgi:predicted nucleic acid-binding Zn ribbon protein|nr:zinc ribbon domain-containing protein [Candidatus Nanoarchaeia archaeon]
MPIYEFSCLSCGYEFEEFLHIDSPDAKCPECGSETRRLISRFSGVVKGSEHRLLDCIIGEDADKRRSILEKRKEKRKAMSQTKGE